MSWSNREDMGLFCPKTLRLPQAEGRSEAGAAGAAKTRAHQTQGKCLIKLSFLLSQCAYYSYLSVYLSLSNI